MFVASSQSLTIIHHDPPPALHSVVLRLPAAAAGVQPGIRLGGL